CSALIWVFRLASAAARALVTWALAAPRPPVAPRGADLSRWYRPAGSVRPLYPAPFSQAASRLVDSQSARSWQPKRARNARLIAESSLQNSPTAPGKADSR